LNTQEEKGCLKKKKLGNWRRKVGKKGKYRGKAILGERGSAGSPRRKNRNHTKNFLWGKKRGGNI